MTAKNFQACLAFTLKYEGGRSNDPRDPGGRTMEGVTQKTYDAYRAKKGLVAKDVYAMPAVERDEIYRRVYWEKVTGNSLPPGVDLCVFDYGVNSGPARALRAYASAGKGRKPADAIRALCEARLSFLHALRTWSTFGKGWGKRVAACEATALQMAGASLDTARDRMRKKKNGADGAAAVAAGGGFVAILKSLGLHWGWTAAVILIFAVAILWFIGKSRSAGGRADALGAAIAEMKAKHTLFEQATKAAAAQAAADPAVVAAKQKGVDAAKAVIAALRAKPPEKT